MSHVNNSGLSIVTQSATASSSSKPILVSSRAKNNEFVDSAWIGLEARPKMPSTQAHDSMLVIRKGAGTKPPWEKAPILRLGGHHPSRKSGIHKVRLPLRARVPLALQCDFCLSFIGLFLEVMLTIVTPFHASIFTVEAEHEDGRWILYESRMTYFVRVTSDQISLLRLGIGRRPNEMAGSVGSPSHLFPNQSKCYCASCSYSWRGASSIWAPLAPVLKMTYTLGGGKLDPCEAGHLFWQEPIGAGGCCSESTVNQESWW